MAFDERLAERIRGSLGRRKGFAEKKMFGGVGFLLHGNMCVGVHGSELIVRLAPEETDAVLKQANTRRFDLTGRPVKGWILVEAARPTAGRPRSLCPARRPSLGLPVPPVIHPSTSPPLES